MIDGDRAGQIGGWTVKLGNSRWRWLGPTAVALLLAAVTLLLAGTGSAQLGRVAADTTTTTSTEATTTEPTTADTTTETTTAESTTTRRRLSP